MFGKLIAKLQLSKSPDEREGKKGRRGREERERGGGLRKEKEHAGIENGLFH